MLRSGRKALESVHAAPDCHYPMKNTRIHLKSNSSAIGQFRTAASLHSHTLYSPETLGFVHRRWSDRVFYKCDDGEVRSLTTLFANRVPGAVTIFVKAIGMMRRYSLRNSCRFAFPRQELVL
jgi:hypothetical protein